MFGIRFVSFVEFDDNYVLGISSEDDITWIDLDSCWHAPLAHIYNPGLDVPHHHCTDAWIESMCDF